MIRRYITLLVFAMWMGGFTFYAEIVIPTATKVLGSGRDVGFITEQVTRWINLIGIAALLVLLWNLVAEWRGLGSRQRLGFAVAWGTAVVSHIGLFATHPFIDELLNAQTHKVRNYDHFVVLHTVYLTFATVQWIAVLSYVLLSLYVWRRVDQQPARIVSDEPHVTRFRG